MQGKLKALVRSRRFWVSVASLLFVVTDQFGFGLDQETVTMLVLSSAAWVVGDSLRKTE